MRRLSSTVMRGNSRRFSGTCAMPSSRMRCAGVVSRSAPSMPMAPSRGPDQTGDHAHQRGLAGAVGTDDADRLAGVDLQRHAEQRLERSVAGVDVAQRQHQARACRGLHRVRVGAEIDLDDPWIGRDFGGQSLGDLSPWSSTITRSTTRISTPMMCSTQMMVIPSSARMRRSMSAACSISDLVQTAQALVRQQQLRSASRAPWPVPASSVPRRPARRSRRAGRPAAPPSSTHVPPPRTPGRATAGPGRNIRPAPRSRTGTAA